MHFIFPVTLRECERSFSAVCKLRNSLRAMTMQRLRSLALMNIHNQQDVNFTHVFCLFCSTIRRKSMKVNCYLSNPDTFSCALYKTCILNFLKMPLNFLKSPSPTYSYSEKKNILLKYFTKEKLLSTFLPK